MLLRDGSAIRADGIVLATLGAPTLITALASGCTAQDEAPYTVERRYLPNTNLLETVFSTSTGRVRVTDAMTVPSDDLGPLLRLRDRGLDQAIRAAAGRGAAGAPSGAEAGWQTGRR